MFSLAYFFTAQKWIIHHFLKEKRYSLWVSTPLNNIKGVSFLDII